MVEFSGQTVADTNVKGQSSHQNPHPDTTPGKLIDATVNADLPAQVVASAVAADLPHAPIIAENPLPSPPNDAHTGPNNRAESAFPQQGEAPHLPRPHKRRLERLAKHEAQRGTGTKERVQRAHRQAFTGKRKESPHQKVRAVIMTHERDAMEAEDALPHHLVYSRINRLTKHDTRPARPSSPA